ncbi:MAG: hypothetical protein LBD86_07025 [Spirochaetaceae bacterium]|nr:hypothetical protein [Spirochaetaceae bacterium]
MQVLQVFPIGFVVGGRGSGIGRCGYAVHKHVLAVSASMEAVWPQPFPAHGGLYRAARRGYSIRLQGKEEAFAMKASINKASIILPFSRAS